MVFLKNFLNLLGLPYVVNYFAYFRLRLPDSGADVLTLCRPCSMLPKLHFFLVYKPCVFFCLLQIVFRRIQLRFLANPCPNLLSCRNYVTSISISCRLMKPIQ